MEIGEFFVVFFAVVVLASIMPAVQLRRWARTGEGADEIRRRTLIVAFVLVVQLGFLPFIGIMLATF